MQTNIYVLTDENKTIRYVGKTLNPLNLRLTRHIRDAKAGQKTYKANWIRQMLAKGLKPGIRLIELVDGDGWLQERFYIDLLRTEGYLLTNLSDGGEASMLGKKHSEETKKKIGAANRIALRGKTHSEETRKRMSESAKRVIAEGRRKPNPAAINKLIEARRKRALEQNNQKGPPSNRSIALRRAYAEGRKKLEGCVVK